MRTFTLLPLAVALAATAAVAAPQQQQTEPQMAEIQVFATPAVVAYKTQPDERDAVKGSYAMDNGSTFKITSRQNRLYAELGQRGVTELVALSADSFIAPAQQMTVKYIPQAFGDQIVLTYPADQNVASSPMVTVTLAAN